jgi:ParB family chromosome partitioning protein
MTKLTAPAAGWNAGKNYYAHPLRIADIVIDPEISRVFVRQENTLEEIYRDIQINGYDKSQPIVVWKGTNIILDGHTRLDAARKAGLEEIPAVEMEFQDKSDAILYTFVRQVIRRNLTAAEILAAVQMMPEGKAKNGTGKSAEVLAGRLGVSATHIYQVRKILKEASAEDIEAVRSEKKSAKEVYNSLRKPKTDAVKMDKEPKKTAGEENPIGSEKSSTFLEAMDSRQDILKSAVILLAESKEIKAAQLLVDHFFRKEQKTVFVQRLPKSVQNSMRILVY